VLAAWFWAARAGREDLLAPAMRPLALYFAFQGRPQQGLDWLTATPAAATGALRSLRHDLYGGVLLRLLGLHPEASAAIERVIQVGEPVLARSDLAFAHMNAAALHLEAAPPDVSRSRLAWRRALDLHREAGNLEGAALSLQSLGFMETAPLDALAMLDEALALAHEARLRYARVMASGSRAEVLLWCVGDYVAALAACSDPITYLAAAGASVFRARISLTLGHIHLARGDLDRAERVARGAFDLCEGFEAHAAVPIRAHADALLGHVERLRGEAEPARAHYGRALAAAGPLRHEEMATAVAQARCGLARLALAERKPAEAVAFAEQAATLLPQRLAIPGVVALLAASLSCAVSLAEAYAQAGDHDAAEATLREVLAQAPRCRPAGLEALAVLANLRRSTGQGATADGLLALVAAHPSTTFEVAERARAALGGRSAAPLRGHEAGELPWPEAMYLLTGGAAV
jgi:tetratricopeptide (TPR) repeat protein